MPCPRCHSNNLWDDNLAWGCQKCDFFSTGNIFNKYDPRDRFNDYDLREQLDQKAKKKCEYPYCSEECEGCN